MSLGAGARRLAFALVRVAAVRDASFGTASSWEVPGPETRVFARHPARATRQCSTFGAYYSSGLTPARRDSGRQPQNTTALRKHSCEPICRSHKQLKG